MVRTITVDIEPVAGGVTLVRTATPGQLQWSGAFTTVVNYSDLSQFPNADHSSVFSGLLQVSGLINLGSVSDSTTIGHNGAATLTDDLFTVHGTNDFTATVTATGHNFSFGATGATGGMSYETSSCGGDAVYCTYFDSVQRDFSECDFGFGSFTDTFGLTPKAGETLTTVSTLQFRNIDPGLFTDVASEGQSYNASLSSMIYKTSFGSVPEPSTWAEMLLGFAGLGAAIRVRGSGRSLRRRSASAA